MGIVICVASLLMVLCLPMLVSYLERSMEEGSRTTKNSRSSRSSTAPSSEESRISSSGRRNITGVEIVILDGPPGHPMVLCSNLKRSLQILTQIESAEHLQHWN